MKYNEKYNRYVTKDGLVYRYDKRQDKLVLCKLYVNNKGYILVGVQKPKETQIRVHRLVYETYIGDIPQGYEIDHINTIKTDNRLENLRCVTRKENANNPLTRKHKSESKKGNKHAIGKPTSDFGRKFKAHYGITKFDDVILYNREHWWYRHHNHICRWEYNKDTNK